MKKLIPLILIPLFNSIIAHSQSCVVIDLADSIHSCPFSPVSLSATLSGTDSVLDVTWSPAAGLSDIHALNPTLTTGASPAWYFITVRGLYAANLVVNGDFSAGNTGFTSSYPCVSGPSSLYPPAVYAISTNPNNEHPMAAWFHDHTSGTGNMMAINGGTTPTNVWCQTITVTPNTDYDFSAWFSNWSSDTTGGLPLIQFQVNGSFLGTGPFTFVPTPGKWTKFNSTWNSGVNTTANLCIYNAQTAYIGNDFAIDDIAFQQICVSKDSVLVEITVNDSSHHRYDTSICTTLGNLTLTAPTGYVNYNWNTGAISSSISVSSTGTYWVYASGGCGILRDTFNVNFILPDSLTLHKDTSVCASVGTVNIKGPAGYQTYLWNTGASIMSIDINSTGTYWVRAINNTSCSVLSDTIRTTFTPVPTVFLGGDTSLCLGDRITLHANHTGNVAYVWNTGSTNSSIVISKGGTYSVIVTENGCTADASINVSEISKPELFLGPDTTLCSEELLRLPVKAGNGSIIWSDGSNDPSFTASVSGTYWAELSNICGMVSDTVHVTYDFCDISFPSAFTPNGDGKNDIIRVIGSLKYYADFSLSIFNRFGQRVFYTQDIHSGWNGVFNGTQQDIGSYFYMISYSLYGKKHLMKGDFQLIR